MHLTSDQATVTCDLPDAELVQQHVCERECGWPGRERRIKVERSLIVIAALDHHRSGRKQSVDMETHGLITGTVYKGQVCPFSCVNGAALCLVDRSTRSAYLHERLVGIQTNDERIVTGQRLVAGNRTALGCIAGLDPTFNGPAAFSRVAGIRCINRVRWQYRGARRVHRPLRHRNRRHVPPRVGIGAVVVRRRHRLRTKLHVRLARPSFVDQYAHS